MQPNEFAQGVEACQLVSLQVLKAVLEDHLGTLESSPLGMDIMEDFEVELMGRV